MDDRVLKEYDTTTSKLVGLLSSLSNEQLNSRPANGSWTAGQIGDHLDRSYNVSNILMGTTEVTKRAPNQKMEEIRELFLNFDIKMDSPKAVEPTDRPIDKKNLLTSL